MTLYAKLAILTVTLGLAPRAIMALTVTPRPAPSYAQHESASRGLSEQWASRYDTVGLACEARPALP
jgi:hypothetical protein